MNLYHDRHFTCAGVGIFLRLRYAYPRQARLKNRKTYERSFDAVLDSMESTSRWRNFHVTGVMPWGGPGKSKRAR
jgi:hypothetical protein